MKRFALMFTVGLALLAAGGAASAKPGAGGWAADWPIGRIGMARVPDSLGVNIHFTKPRPGEMRMLAAAGFRWIRMDFAWGATERTKGHYDFHAYDRLLAALERHRLRALWILDYGNPLYQHGHAPTTPAARHAFCRWVVAALRHFKGHGIVWEMWNEPNGGSFSSGTGGPMGHWGGADDGVLHFPTTSAAFGVLNVARPGLGNFTGTLDFSGASFAAAKGRPATLKLFARGRPWKFWNGAEFPGAKGSFKLAKVHAQPAGALSYNFSGGGNYVDATTGLRLRGPGVLRFEVRSALAPQTVLVRITDHTGQTLQFYRTCLTAGRWQEFHIPLGRWPSVTAAYARLALDVGKTIRRVAPQELYVGPALAGVPHLNFLRGCFQAGLLKYWNAVTVHPYRPGGPESVVADYAAIRKLIARYAPPGKRIPLLSGEWGYSSTWYRGNNGHQARYVARELLVNLWRKIPLSIYYDWHNDGANPANREDNFGLVDFAYHPARNPVYTPKPAYLAVKTLASQLHGCVCTGRLQVGHSNDYILRFAGPGGERIVVWETGRQSQTVLLPLNSGRWQVTNYIGTKTRTVVVPPGVHGLKLAISHNPQYLIRR